MNVAAYADGALAEILGSFFGELLERRPEAFLRGLMGRRRNDQECLCRLAASLDGS
jgi:hypothetical protein